jgi:hypothetical protein
MNEVDEVFLLDMMLWLENYPGITDYLKTVNLPAIPFPTFFTLYYSGVVTLLGF